MVEAPYAWLEDSLAKTMPGAGPNQPPDDVAPVLSLQDLQREHALACAGVALGFAGPQACRRRSASQLQTQLLAAGAAPALV